MLGKFFSSLLFIALSVSSAYAANLDPQEAIAAAIAEQLHEPQPDPDGRVQTLNQKGAMSPKVDKTSAAFIKHASLPDTKSLEIGAGYGLACIEALRRGARNYTANDMDARHLKILAQNVNNQVPKSIPYLKLNASTFPDPELGEGYDAILVARVLHFMKPDEVDKAVKALHQMLKPGGKAYVVVLTPYVRGYKSFIPEFEKRIQRGDPHPGYVELLADFADPTLILDKKRTMKPFHFFNAQTAKDLFTRNGFIVEKCDELPLAYASKVWQLDGRENVGVIARKEGSSPET